METRWEHCFARRTLNLRSSAIRELLKVTESRDVISFAGGLPAPQLFPIPAFQEACSKLLTESGETALQYGTTEGYRPLREFVASKYRDEGTAVTVENVLVTASSQQGLDLLGKLFLDPGDRVVVEAPSYVGALQAFQMYGAEFLPVPIDDDGARCDFVEKALQSDPKFAYFVPNFQNPSGVTLSLSRRMRILAMADQHGVPIVEDDPYQELRFEGEGVTSLLSLDQQSRGGLSGNVIHLGTFSKILSPGLRLGWVVAPAEIIAKLVLLKQGTDLHTSTFNQMLAYEMVSAGLLQRHIPEIRHVYRERCNVMLNALEEFCPPGVAWTRPHGGLFLWVTLPAGVDSRVVLEAALQQHVAFVPGDAFFPNPELGSRYMRLNFSNAAPERIREGIRRLSIAVRQEMQIVELSRAAING
jgi:2-aminoadipate transaminase